MIKYKIDGKIETELQGSQIKTNMSKKNLKKLQKELLSEKSQLEKELLPIK